LSINTGRNIEAVSAKELRSISGNSDFFLNFPGEYNLNLQGYTIIIIFHLEGLSFR